MKKTQVNKKFDRCVKLVMMSNNPEAKAIAICTKSVLFKRGLTIKRFRKGRLVTQRRRHSK
jgi:hypothetical protein